jgi:hypothetical protein
MGLTVYALCDVGWKMTHAEKLAAAIQWLGERYVCHPVNRVKKLATPLPEVFTWRSKALKRRAA